MGIQMGIQMGRVDSNGVSNGIQMPYRDTVRHKIGAKDLDKYRCGIFSVGSRSWHAPCNARGRASYRVGAKEYRFTLS